MAVEFANVQFRSKSGGEPPREELLDAIGVVVPEEGAWERVEREEEADISLAVGPRHGEGWIGVYFRDPQPGALAGNITREVSEHCAAVAVAVQGEGSTLRIGFVDAGRHCGEYDSRQPGSFETEGAEFAERLADDTGGDSIREVWEEPAEHADEAVEAFAARWGMDPVLVSAGYHYLGLNVDGPVDELHFRRAESSAEVERVGGAAAFESAGRVRELEASVGEQFRATASFGNRGGRVDGIRVRVGGDVVDASAVEIETVRVDGGTAGEYEEREATYEMDDAGERVAVATFPERTVEGALSEDVDFSELSEEQSREVMAAHRASRLSIYALGRATSPGEGEIYIEVDALTEGAGESARERSTLVVYPQSRLPRPADPETAPAHTLRQLQKEETLFALVHFDQPIGAWASLAAEAIGSWVRAIAGADETFVKMTVENLRSRPDESLVGADVLRDDEQLAELVGTIGDLYQFGAILRPSEGEEADFEPAATGGVSYFSLAGPESGPDGEPAPALGFWVGIEGRPTTEVEELTETLEGIVDRLARSGRVIQAVCDRWAWAPAMSVRALPFEIVCGLSSSQHLRLDWLQRYLRAPTRTVWLGAPLWDRLESEAVEEVAAVEARGPLRRIRLRESEDLDAYERALEPLLPDADVWRREAE